MATRFRLIALLLCVGISALARAQQAAPGAATALSVVSAGPTGELGSVAQAAEIRVRFSEPMVPIGRLPEQVSAPFFSVRPAIAGTFRWAGPTILVFTPDPAKALPNATRYVVTIATSATAVSGRRLPQPFAFAFTTPTGSATFSATRTRARSRSAAAGASSSHSRWPPRPARRRRTGTTGPSAIHAP